MLAGKNFKTLCNLLSWVLLASLSNIVVCDCQVDGLPGYVLEPVSREVRKLNIQSFQSGPRGDGADGDGMSEEELVRPSAAHLLHLLHI